MTPEPSDRQIGFFTRSRSTGITDLSSWLAELGLGKYSEVFANNGYGKSRAEAAAETEQALGFLRSKYNCLLIVPEVLCRVGEAYLDAGLISDAERTLNEAAGLMKQTGEVYWEPELHRARGRLAAMNGKRGSEEPAREFRKAIDIAGKRGMKLLELRASTALARLWAERGDEANAIAAVEDSVEVGPPMELTLKGFHEPVEVFRLTAARR